MFVLTRKVGAPALSYGLRFPEGYCDIPFSGVVTEVVPPGAKNDPHIAVEEVTSRGGLPTVKHLVARRTLVKALRAIGVSVPDKISDEDLGALEDEHHDALEEKRQALAAKTAPKADAKPERKSAPESLPTPSVPDELKGLRVSEIKERLGAAGVPYPRGAKKDELLTLLASV